MVFADGAPLGGGARGAAPGRGVLAAVVLACVVVAGIGVASFLWSEHRLGAGRDETGRVVRAGRVATGAVRAGDCLSREPASPAQWVDVTPCAGSHQAEVYDVRALAAGPYSEVPAVAAAECSLAWANGSAATRSAAAAAHGVIAVLVPTAAGWADGDRGVACAVAGDTRAGPLATP